jgi:ABC-type transporter MlaC component
MNESVRIIFNKIYDLILKNKVIAIAFLLITILIIFSFLSFSVDDDKVSVNLEEEKKTIQSENEFLEKNQASENLSDQEDKEEILKKKQIKKIQSPIPKKKPSPPKESQKIMTSSPSQTLELLHDALKKINTSKIDIDKMQKVISDTYDVERMLFLIIGEAWKVSEDKPRANLKKVFEEYIAKNYIRRFSSIKKLEFDKLDIKKVGNNYLMAKTKLIINSNDEVALSYLLNQTNKSWKIFDVLIDGSISEIATKKSEFKSFTIEGNLKPLLEALKKKNSMLLNN